MKDEIKALQIKAAEICDHFENRSAVYVRSGQEIFEANREYHDDAFLASCVATKGQFGSEAGFDITEIAKQFKEQFSGFIQER